MELSRIERFTLTLFTVISALAVFILLRGGYSDSGWQSAAEVSAGTLAFALFYGAFWYKSRPPHDATWRKRLTLRSHEIDKGSWKVTLGDDGRPEKVRRERIGEILYAQRNDQKRLLVGAAAISGVTSIALPIAAWYASDGSTTASGWAQVCSLVLLISLPLFTYWYFSPIPDEWIKPSREDQDTDLPSNPRLLSKCDVKVEPLYLDFLKLEYTKAAERYENIYRAVWQNFSYMSVVSAGILTFGQKSLSMPVLASLALTPITFWYFATFLPMDHYGDEVRETMSRVDRYINRVARFRLLGHFETFASFRYHWRVRDPVRALGTTLTFLWFVSAASATGHLLEKYSERPAPGEFATVVAAQLDSLELSEAVVDSAVTKKLERIVALSELRRSKDSVAAVRRAMARRMSEMQHAQSVTAGEGGATVRRDSNTTPASDSLRRSPDSI